MPSAGANGPHCVRQLQAVLLPVGRVCADCIEGWGEAHEERSSALIGDITTPQRIPSMWTDVLAKPADSSAGAVSRAVSKNASGRAGKLVYTSTAMSRATGGYTWTQTSSSTRPGRDILATEQRRARRIFAEASAIAAVDLISKVDYETRLTGSGRDRRAWSIRCIRAQTTPRPNAAVFGVFRHERDGLN